MPTSKITLPEIGDDHTRSSQLWHLLGEQEVFELEITVNDTKRMKVHLRIRNNPR